MFPKAAIVGTRVIAATLALFLATLLPIGPVHAQAHHGGGGGPHGEHGGFHGGHGGHGGHGSVFFDFGFGAPFYPYYYAPYPYYYPPYYYPPAAYYAPPAYYAPAPAPPAPAAPGPLAAVPQSWYYCDNPQGYYPYVTSCAGGWRQVPSQPQ